MYVGALSLPREKEKGDMHNWEWFSYYLKIIKMCSSISYVEAVIQDKGTHWIGGEWSFIKQLMQPSRNEDHLTLSLHKIKWYQNKVVSITKHLVIEVESSN